VVGGTSIFSVSEFRAPNCPARRYDTGIGPRTKASTGTDIRGKYRRTFHYAERMEQWCCRDPEVPRVDFFVIKMEARKSSIYPKLEYFTMADVFRVLRAVHMTRYKENWKTLLWRITGTKPDIPDQSLVEACEERYSRISRNLSMVTEPGHFGSDPLILGAKGKRRKNMLHLNYIHRKIMESFGVYSWHHEFPLLKNSRKIVDLDRATSALFSTLDIPFSYSVYLTFPKCRIKIRCKKKRKTA